MRPHFFICCLLVLCGLSPQDSPAGQVENATSVFTLSGLSLPDLAAPRRVDMRLAPGQSETVSLPPGKSRLKADMGMVRFVFPAGEYGTARKLVVQGSDKPVLVVTDARGIPHRVPGTMLNLRAADAGDEAVFDCRQFLSPADAADVGAILGLSPEQLASGWEGAVAYGPLRGTGHLRLRHGRVRLTISGKLTPETVASVLDALEAQGRLWRVALPGRGKVSDGIALSGAQRPKALRQLASDVQAGLRSKAGVALLASVDSAASGGAVLAPNPSEDARCVLVGMDFATARWRLSFVTTAQARARMKTS
ncbi:hypothetical protein K9F62_10555 [Desulfovibrio sp. JY]|nr:hypothetical protein K9F62_10555 [Desulfovibrio sp. JY]